ncbi:MAG: carbohydrate-binding family V/XII [Chloracidobacterium sp.]|nr:carbohydrate-binding family V/XII [Chloracidobacterium sp.]
MKFILLHLVISTGILIFTTLPLTVQGQSKPNNKTENSPSDSGWPRKFAVDGTAFSIYQPQIEEWSANRFTARSAISVTEGQGKQLSYGVLWFNARTEVDKGNRLVTLNDFEVAKVSLPTAAPDKLITYQNILQTHARKKDDVIALDRLLADLAVNQTNNDARGHEVKNEAPQVFFSTKPAILIMIDGSPELRPVEGTKLERVINTRVLILQDPSNRRFYLRLMDGWLEAESLTGPWRVANNTPTDLTKALELAVASKQVDLLDGSAGGSDGSKPSLSASAKQAGIPEIRVNTGPAELLQTQGEPQTASIDGTRLVYVTNTENDIFVYTDTQDHYILIAGRWFSSQSMKGPWVYVPGEKLPRDFAKIPPTHLKANVLASVPGTPQAKEALIANSVPQTATIKLSAATLAVKYDGAPRFKRIENTTLQYAVNTATPVIAVDSKSYYAVQNGVWFVAAAPTGTWAVATTIPAVIYTIPTSSPIHYVTYVKIYGSTPEVVYVGYTPGYYGTVVSSTGVVVYGTGWYYPPYIGTYWYGAPYTYGCGAAFTWGVSTGWGLAYGYGYAWSSYYYPAPWWGPVGYAGVGYYGAYGWGGVAAANVYGQWGNVAYSGTRAAWANPYTGNVGRGGVYTGTNTVTGTRYAARGGTNTNVYTGTTVTGGGAVAYNPNTGRISAGQAGTVSNAYTGNSAAGTRGGSYNPQTGVVSGGAVGGVRNGSTGQVTAGGSAFAYNTTTNTGVAVANNNVYAGKDGNVYRYNPSSGVQQNTGSGWQSVQRSADKSWVQNQQQARSVGEMRTRDFSSMRGNLGGGGGLRGGGRRR